MIIFDKKMKFILVTLGVIIFVVAITIPFAYTSATSREDEIDELRKEIERLEQEAEQYRSNILDKQGQANTLEREIGILNDRIYGLQSEINATTSKIDKTELEILSLQEQIFNTTQQIDKHKKTVGELVTQMYEMDRMNMVTLLLNSQKLSDFATKAQNIRSFNDQLSDLLDDLKTQKDGLELTRNDLDSKKQDLESYNTQQRNQRSSIQVSRNNKDSILDNTKGEEAKYQKLLKEVEGQKTKFFAELKSLESVAIERGSYIIHVRADSIPPAGTQLFDWPYDRLTLTQEYGMTSYAKRGAYGGQQHNGIDIVSGYGSAIQSIGEGTVLMSGFNSGYGNWVAIEHDNGMVSVYAHMNSPTVVGNGQRVDRSTTIGFEGSTGYSTGSHLHLALYKEFFTYVRERNIYFNYFEGTLNPFNYLPDL